MSDRQFQGDLDGLCGMYSVYNAIRTLFDLQPGVLDEIVKEAMNQFKPESFKAFFYDGMNDPQLESLIKRVRKLLKERDLTLVVKKEQSMKCDAMLNKMKTLGEQENCVFIIGISGRCLHWTCVEKASVDCMMLVDSGGMKQLRQSSFKVSDDESDGSVYKVGSEFWVLIRK